MLFPQSPPATCDSSEGCFGIFQTGTYGSPSALAVCFLLVLLPAGDAHPTALCCSFLKERPTLTVGKSFPENTEIKQKKANLTHVFLCRLLHTLTLRRHPGPQIFPGPPGVEPAMHNKQHDPVNGHAAKPSCLPDPSVIVHPAFPTLNEGLWHQEVKRSQEGGKGGVFLLKRE